MASKYAHIKEATPLFDRLEAISKGNVADFPSQSPTPEFDAFVTLIETADPNSSSYEDEDTNEGWGHFQFNINGPGTIKSLVSSWEAVGNVQQACRLIAAAVRTARVARHVCVECHVRATQWTADAYVDRVVVALWAIVQPTQVRHS